MTRYRRAFIERSGVGSGFTDLQTVSSWRTGKEMIPRQQAGVKADSMTPASLN